MRKPPSFEAQYETANGIAEALRPAAERCVGFVAEFARHEVLSDNDLFVAEDNRFQAFAADRARFAELLAELVAGLDGLTAEVSADLDSFRGLTRGEKMVGWFSRQRMWRRHSNRVRAAPVVERLRDLLVRSDAVAGLIAAHRNLTLANHKAAEASLIDIVEHRRRLVDKIDIARIRIKELNAKALTTQGRIGLYGSRAEGQRMELERQELKTEAARISVEEQKMRDESQRRERFIGLFQTFVDALNAQIALCNTLIRKLMIDTEERLVIYQAQVDTDIPGSKVRIAPEIFPHIAGPIGLFERGMLVPQELERRKSAADAAFGKRFAAFAPRADEVAGAPIIDMTRKSTKLRLRFLRSWSISRSP